MNIDNYLAHYQRFHAEFCPDAAAGDKLRKCLDECRELITAATFSSDENAITDELLDVMNTAIATIYARGIVNPLDAGARKLERTAEKYRARVMQNSAPDALT
jgi:hypothetical protein